MLDRNELKTYIPFSQTGMTFTEICRGSRIYRVPRHHILIDDWTSHRYDSLIFRQVCTT